MSMMGGALMVNWQLMGVGQGAATFLKNGGLDLGT